MRSREIVDNKKNSRTHNMELYEQYCFVVDATIDVHRFKEVN